MIWPMKSISLLIVSVAVCLLMIGIFPIYSYSQETSVESAEDAVAVESPEYVYNSAGRRDPFVPLVQQIRQSKAKPTRNLGPLEKFDLSQFRLLAMLIVKGTPRAMVKAPDGKSYSVKPGDLIGPNGGVVARIETKTVAIDEASGQRIEKSPDRIVVEEVIIDSYTGRSNKEERYIEM